MGKSKGASEAVMTALQTEADGIMMYNRAAQNTTYELGRKMFLSLVEDEKAHKRIIEEVADGMGIDAAMKDARPGTPRKRLKTVFSEAKDVVTKLVKPTTSDKEALHLAMEFEQNGHKFYMKAAQEANDPQERSLFEFLAGEESEHYDVLQRAADYLDETGHWFLWDEGGLLEG